MKNYLIVITMLLLTSLSLSCKKDEIPKDYATFITGNIFWGTFTFTGQNPNYYSVYFKADSTLIWSQYAGDYPGRWTVVNNRLTITYGTNKLMADITESGLVTRIEDESPAYTINNCELITNPQLSLDNSNWNGQLIGSFGPEFFQLRFMPGFQVEASSNGTSPQTFTYIRSVSGVVTRMVRGTTQYYFGVIITAKEMRGEYFNTYLWTATKQ